MTDTPNLDDALFPGIDADRLFSPPRATHPPRFLILYGSLRARSFSRLAAEEAARILTRLGAEVRFFNPSGLPLVDDGVDATHPKVRELHDCQSARKRAPRLGWAPAAGQDAASELTGARAFEG